jgi:hypothetical protein
MKLIKDGRRLHIGDKVKFKVISRERVSCGIVDFVGLNAIGIRKENSIGGIYSHETVKIHLLTDDEYALEKALCVIDSGGGRDGLF